MVDPIVRELVVIAVHGEGDRGTVNSLQQHRNNLEIQRLMQGGAKVPSKLKAVPDESPEVIVVLRDPNDPSFKLDLPLMNWDEVDHWKLISGWDNDLRHWKTGAKIKVNLGV